MRLLLSKCQEEFETRSKASSAFDKRDGVLSAAEQHAKQVAKRKMLGNIKFIGELGKLELLHEAILHKCIQQLLAKKKRTSLSEMAEDIECMCQIMSTTGKRLDTAKAKNIMEQYFKRVNMLSHSEELPSRIRFMLQDVIDLRSNRWIPRRIQMENGPRSVTQMRWESMGPMMAPPFPFFPSGMPMPPNMPMPPFPGASDGTMSWFGDPMLAGGMVIPSMNSKLPADYHDENKDIFGKPVNKVPTSSTNHFPVKKSAPSVPRGPSKPDLFEPHYMKSKSATKPSNYGSNENSSKRPPTSDDHHQQQHPQSADQEKDRKPKTINKNNPWNIDPFAPHFTKPTVGIFNQSDGTNRNKMEGHYNGNNSNNNSRSSTPPSRYSPPQVPRSSAANSYNKQQQQQQQQSQAWKKNNGEVSLRPSSYLSKKEEKQTTAKKSEELSSKMQQFTNLTINDKTNKSKKTALSKADVDKKILEVTEKYKTNKDLAYACNELQSLATNLKYSKMVAKQLLLYSSSQPDEQWVHLKEICMQCVTKDVFSSETLINAFTQLLDDMKIMESKSGKQFMAVLSAMFVANEMMTLPGLLNIFDGGKHHLTLLYCFSKLTNDYGKTWLEEALAKSKVDLKTIFPKCDRSDDQVMQVVNEMGMPFLFPHLCIKAELLELMKSGHDQSFLSQWVVDNASESISKKLLIHVVVTCAITMATIDTLEHGNDLTQKPDKTLQDKEKEVLLSMSDFLKRFLGSEEVHQLEGVYALQVFCCERDFPKEMLLRLFLCFYNMEVIEEEVFLKWKEDLNDSYPGKGKSLFQVNNWLQWLETADVEEEDEENNEED